MTKKRILESYLDAIQNDKKVNLNEIGLIMTAYTVSILISSIMSLYRNIMSGKAKACKNYVGHDKSLCNIKYDITQLNTVVGKLKGVLAKCQESKCHNRVNKKLEKIQNKLDIRVKQYNLVKAEAI